MLIFSIHTSHFQLVSQPFVLLAQLIVIKPEPLHLLKTFHPLVRQPKSGTDANKKAGDKNAQSKSR